MTVNKLCYRFQSQKERLVGSLKVSGINTDHGAAKYFKSGTLHLEQIDSCQINLVVNINPDETRYFNIIKYRLSAKAYLETGALYITSGIDRTFTLNFRLDTKKAPPRALQDFANSLNDEVQRAKQSGHVEANNNRPTNGPAMNTCMAASPNNNSSKIVKSPLRKLASPSNTLKKTIRGGIESFYGSPKITDTASKFNFGRSPGASKRLVPNATDQQHSMNRFDIGTNWSDGQKNNNNSQNSSSMRNNSNNQVFTSLITDSQRPNSNSGDGQLQNQGAVSPVSSNTPTKTGTSVSPTNQSSSMGLANLGNTCYMNAVLQPLLAIPCFQNDLMNPKHVQLVLKEASVAVINSNTSGPNSPTEDKENNFTNFSSSAKKDTHLYKVFVQLLATKVKRGKGLWKESSLDSRTQFLHSLKKAVASVEQQFAGHTQNDAHEFLSLCLDLLRDEVVRINKSLPSLTNDIVTMSSQDLAIAGIGHEEQENWPPKSMLLSSEMDCPVTSNFQFTVRHTIMCTGCGFKLDQPEKMLILSLFLPEPKDESSPVFCLTDAFRSFFNEETLEYTCDVCGHKEAKLQHKLLQLPRVLIIHLKRYKVHHELGSVCKDFRNVQIPKYIDVQNVVSANSSLPTVPEEIKEPELENVLRRLSGHNRIELNLPSPPPASSENEAQPENNSSSESSISRLERLNAYESGYNSASAEASSSHSASSMSHQPLSVIISSERDPPKSSDELSQKQGNTVKSEHHEKGIRAQDSVDEIICEDETPCKPLIDSSEDDDRNLASIRKELRSKATQISCIKIDPTYPKLSPGIDMDMKTPERKTPEKKTATRDFLDELPPKLSKLSQSARKFLSPIRGPKFDGSYQGSMSKMVPRSRDRASTMFDDAMESVDGFLGKEKTFEDVGRNALSGNPRKSRRLFLKRTVKAKEEQEMNSQSRLGSAGFEAASAKHMGAKRTHKKKLVLEPGEMEDPQEVSDLAEAIQLSMQHHIETQEEKDLEMALQLSKSILETSAAIDQQNEQHSQSDLAIVSCATQNSIDEYRQRKQPTFKIEPLSQEWDRDEFRGTCLQADCFTQCQQEDPRNEQVMNINKFRCTDLDNCSYPADDIKPTSSSRTYAPRMHNNGLTEFTVICATVAQKPPREREDDVVKNEQSDDEVMMEIDCTYDSDDNLVNQEYHEEGEEEVFVESIKQEKGVGKIIKQESEKLLVEDRKRTVTPPPPTDSGLSLAQLRVISTPSPGKSNRMDVLNRMESLSPDFRVHPTSGEEKQGLVINSQTSQEEIVDEDSVTFPKIEVESHYGINSIGTFGSFCVENNTILNCRFDEELDGGCVYLDLDEKEGIEKMECHIEDVAQNMRDIKKEQKGDDVDVCEAKNDCESNHFCGYNEPKLALREEANTHTVSEQTKISSSASDDFSAYSYQLTSIICHLGQSASVGHYVSDVFNPETGTWCCFDDETVSSREEADVLTSRQKPGYIFFYTHRSLCPDGHSSEQVKGQ